MTNPLRKSVVAGLLCWSLGYSLAQAQQPGPGGPPGGAAGMNGGDRFGNPGMSGGEFGQPPDGSRAPGQDWPQPGNRGSLPGAPPAGEPSRNAGAEKIVPLNDVVSMVQERFNATAVKTDSVMQSGQLVYRVRLLSADKSRVWTVTVDARTGRVN
jgi:hypothetical protein